MVISEWRDPLRSPHGSEAAEALAHAPVPVMVVHGDVSKFDRLVIVAGPDVATPSGRVDMARAAQLAPQLAHGARVATVATAPASLRELFPDKQHVEWIESSDPVGWIAGNLHEGDVPMFVGTDSANAAMNQVPALIEGRFLIVQAARAETALPHPEPITGPVVPGRSLKPRPA